MKIQPRVKGGRKPLPASVIKEIEEAVRFVAKEYNISRSWVVATALATFFDIDIRRYDDVGKKRKKR
jgi:hypothetical protein